MARRKRQNALVTNETTASDPSLESPPAAAFVQNCLQVLRSKTERMIRNETLEGLDYVVVPMVMMTEGVHAGSNGPLYYPKDELAKTPAVWNHKPIVVYHPTMNGSAVSACDPIVLNKRKVGLILNTKWESGKGKEPGRLLSEAWLQVSRLEEVDKRVLTAIQNKEVMEVSTGLFTDNEQTPGVWKKEDYSAVARHYRPDHLALLPDETGACSVKDGAGLMRNAAFSHEEIRQKLNDKISAKAGSGGAVGALNSFPWVCDVYDAFCVYSKGGKYFKQAYTSAEGDVALAGSPVEVTRKMSYMTTDGQVVNTQGEREMNKTKLVDSLISNKGTNWTEADRDQLMALSDDVLSKMVPVEDKTRPTSNATYPKGKECPECEGTGKVDGKDCPECGGEGTMAPAENMRRGQPAANKAVTVEEYIANAPDGMRDVLASGLRAHNEKKDRLITEITANKQNVFTAEFLGTKDLQELEALAALARGTGKPVVANARFNYGGQGDAGSPGSTASQQTPLAIPTMNFRRTSDED